MNLFSDKIKNLTIMYNQQMFVGASFLYKKVYSKDMYYWNKKRSTQNNKTAYHNVAINIM
ncbi:MAG: hypothetical protein Q3983_03315 [Capnocytophaga sp.]|nr:hypothetical protein [Capnocytophaga sp.]